MATSQHGDEKGEGDDPARKPKSEKEGKNGNTFGNSNNGKVL